MTKTPWFPRVLPFAVYMLFILIYDILLKMLPDGPMIEHLGAIIYPVKTIAVMIALAFCWKACDELKWAKLKAKEVIIALSIGALVFVLWINMTWDFAVMGEAAVYNPKSLPELYFYAFIAVRLFGASVIVPIFEEVFWRSFILRYIIDPDFDKVEIGAFTWPSFIVSSLLFGVEHHLWLAGIMAGIFYNFLLYKTRNLWYCIISHGLTNLLLGLYVLQSGRWEFW